MDFLRLCEKTRDSLGLQYELPFMSHISWSDISKRDISDPDIPTGEELLVKEKDDQSQEWIYSDFEINTCKNLLDFGSGPGLVWMIAVIHFLKHCVKIIRRQMSRTGMPEPLTESRCVLLFAGYNHKPVWSGDGLMNETDRKFFKALLKEKYSGMMRDLGTLKSNSMQVTSAE